MSREGVEEGIENREKVKEGSGGFLKGGACKRLRSQFSRYLVVGSIATLFDMGILMLLVSSFDVHPLIANICGYCIGIFVNYGLSVRWVFLTRNVQNRTLEFTVFTLVGIGGLGFSEFAMYIGTIIIGLDYRVAKICAIGAQLLWNFFGRKYLLFRDQKV